MELIAFIIGVVILIIVFVAFIVWMPKAEQPTGKPVAIPDIKKVQEIQATAAPFISGNRQQRRRMEKINKRQPVQRGVKESRKIVEDFRQGKIIEANDFLKTFKNDKNKKA